MGHILYQRYMHPTKYRSSYDELASWLNIYHDHPGAKRVYRLAMKRKPARSKAPHKPKKQYGIRGAVEDVRFKEELIYTNASKSRNRENKIRRFFYSVKRDLRKQRITYSLKRIASSSNKNLLTNLEYDYLKGHIANGYMHVGETEKALDIAQQAAKRSGSDVALANWVAGITAWKMEEYSVSAFHFEQAAESEFASKWTLSASAYWAARVNKRLGKRREAKKWLRKASHYPRTFYGLVAARSLGHDLEFEWSIPQLRANYTERLAKESSGRRALALLDVGQRHLAEKELRTIHPHGDKVLESALIAVASHAKLPGLSMQIAGAITSPQGTPYDTALYPVAPWRVDEGVGVDRALVNAFIRQESKFDPLAKNRYSGARGLMQLMPRTASSISNINFRGGNRDMLLDPELNVNLGQRYIAQLLGRYDIEGNMLLLAAAYNGGPGNLRKWRSEMGEDIANDPLLFVESIPVAETRAFVTRIMTNYWIYRIRMGQPTPTLDMVADGKWPIYTPLDEPYLQVASR
jgi:soluble lytic murein transglycosylase-like protein